MKKLILLTVVAIASLAVVYGHGPTVPPCDGLPICGDAR